MTVEADLKTLLAPLVSGRVYPDLAPLGAARPCITYQQVGGESVSFVERALPSKENARMQVNVWADTRADAKAIIKLAEAALITAATMQVEAIGASQATYEPDTKVYGAMQDFSVWSDR